MTGSELNGKTLTGRLSQRVQRLDLSKTCSRVSGQPLPVSELMWEQRHPGDLVPLTERREMNPKMPDEDRDARIMARQN